MNKFIIKLYNQLPSFIKSSAKRIWLKPLDAMKDCPELFRFYRYWSLHPELKRVPGGWIYRNHFYPDYLTVGGAGVAVFQKALAFCQGTGIDVGAGFWPLPGSIPVDVNRGPGREHKISDFKNDFLDYIFSSHCLEHIEEWEKEIHLWIQKLKCGGIMFLYLPHPDCEIWSPGSPFVGDGHKWAPSPDAVKNILIKEKLEILAFDDGPDAMYSFYVCGRKVKTISEI